MLVPTALFFILNNYLPIIGVYYAFTKFNYAGGLFYSPFVGLDNFKFLIQSGKLGALTFNTIAYNLVFIFLGNFLQIFLAILLSQMVGKVFKKVAQSIIFLPYFVSYVILSVIVYSLFNYEVGFVNGTLRSLGQEPFDAYNTPNIWPFLMVLFHLWKGLGYGTVVYLAAIMGISQEFYEAAKIDGANIFQQIRYITIPLLVPTFIMLLLFALGGIMRGQFDLFYQVIGTNGVLYDVTDILDTYVYRALKQDYDIGMGTAASLYQSIFGFIIIMVVNTIVRKKQPDYALF